MESFIQYILISTFCLSILYIGYLVFQKRENRFHILRYYLLISMVLSLLIPFSSFKINLNLSPAKYEIEEIHHETVITTTSTIETTISQPTLQPVWSLDKLFFAVYITGVVFLSLRFLIQIIKILYLFSTSKKLKREKMILLSNNAGSPFTFFNWIFIPGNYSEDNETKDIIMHERIHASQYHSIDLIMVELLLLAMWFNPLVWMMKKSIQLVHEYLADEGVLNTGADKLRYQATLINHATEDQLISFSSGFTHSIIKKRIDMMTKKRFNQGSRFRILALVPLTLVLIIGVACINGEKAEKNMKLFTVVIDAGHGGKDKGAILNDKISEKDINLSMIKILKGKAASNTKYNLIFTREKDEYLQLEKRIVTNADLFISIHSFFSNNKDNTGIHCYIPKDSNYKTESQNIGKLLLSEFGQISGINSSPKEADFYVLRKSLCPALLINIGYLSDANDLSLIDKQNQELICDKILNAVNRFNQLH